ncbi:MAG: patatin-like phospholipase family protein [Chitinophagales bacterium]
MNTLEVLRNIPYFKNLSLEAFEELHQKADIINLQCGKSLLSQGDTGDDIYVLLDGRLRAIRESKGSKVILGEISRGEIVGEMATLLGEKRNATIIAIRNSVLLKLKGADFTALLQQQQTSINQLIRTVVDRTKKTFVPKQKIISVAVVPLADNLNLEHFLPQLTQELQKYASTKLVSDASLQKTHPDIFKDENRVSSLLAKYEDEYDFLLYQTDSTWNDWTKHCVSRADKILIVANSKQSPEIGEFEAELLQTLQKTNQASWELILLHDSKAQKPKDTRFWLEKRNIARHYHIVPNDLKDIQRLSRFLTGNTIGVALSGGGFRAVSQAGILHAIMESGIPIDIIGGSSGGAFIGGGYACVDKPEDIPQIIQKGDALFKDSKVLTFPIVSLFSGKHFTNGMKGFFKDFRIEDLWIDYFCISLSLVSGKLIIHEEGPLWKTVRASTSVMGILPPVIENGECLVDGGLINSCPTNILVQKGAGKVIVINASTQSGIKVDNEFPPTISGWSLLARKLNPFNKKKIGPTILTNITQSMYMASNHLQDRVYADSNIDLFIVPPISEADSMTLDASVQLYEEGYQYGLSQVDNWKQQLNLS